MNNRLLRVIVLLISITGAGAFVWFSSQQDKPSPTTPQEKTAAGDENKPSDVAEEEEAPAMLSSSKSIDVIFSEKDVRKLIEPDPDPSPLLPEENTISDEEVRKRRDAMMGSSKIGRIMSEEDVRKLMEKEAEEKAPFAQPPANQQEE